LSKTKRFSRDEFLKELDYFYRAIEDNARSTTEYSEKQSFLNTVYERFFQGFSPKTADTHGIVYTPQPIVNFMVRSVEETLKKEFGKSLGDREVHILDPFVGTGNFIVRVMQEIPKTRLQYKYENELHCNEVMLLPYYIASMNIEHAYLDATGEYKPFEGICLVDTFELAEASQIKMFTAKNTERVQKQKDAEIFVVIGNPPYNVGQESESDNNKNRKYEVLDKRVRLTYAKSSLATNKNALNDPYVKALRWATDRIEEEGIVAFVTNNSFVHGVSFDGVRKELAKEFSEILHINLKGDARTTSERRRQEAGNVFDDEIKVSVGITLFIRRKGVVGCTIRMYDIEDYLGSEAKRSLLDEFATMGGTPLQTAFVSSDNFWVLKKPDESFSGFITMGSKSPKASESPQSIFATHGAGVATSRDAWAYNSDRASLHSNIKKAIASYNAERNRWISSKNNAADVDDFVRYDNSAISWSRDLKQDLVRNREAIFSEDKLRVAQYRPFQKQFLYFDRLFNEEVYVFPQMFPTAESEKVNLVICLNDIAARSPLGILISNKICDLHVCSSDRFQCFPFYIYDEDGTHRRENITDWALDQFRSHYKDKSITKWDIFYYTYAVLHHPEYRTRYAANLKRELPRIPYAPDWDAFAKAGKRLAELHVDYEKQKEYPLERREKPGERLNLRVEKMRLSKNDAKQTLVYNDFLTLIGIPKETYDYRLGNRSALEWVIDQYQVSTDKRSGITNDPNRDDDKEYILRLIGQVITVSLETVKIVNALPDLGRPKAEKAAASKTVQ
jgi:predicted helicase